MYKVLLVDDEAPALRYLQSIMTKYFPTFSVAASLPNGKEALEFLKTNRVDLVITDIHMPLVDGLELSKQARALYPDLRIIIVSGYSDFEYAKEAIAASVDDYILKPIDHNQIIETVQSVCQKLSDKRVQQETVLLPMLASGYELDTQLIERVFSNQQFLFAMVRFGNLPVPSIAEPKNITVISHKHEWYALLQGRDDNEHTIIAKADELTADFGSLLGRYIADSDNEHPTVTVLYDPHPQPISALPAFIHDTTNAIQHSVVIGKKSIISLPNQSLQEYSPVRIENSSIKYLKYLISGAKHKKIREFFYLLSDQWEQDNTPQIDVSRIIALILDCALADNPILYDKQEELIAEVNDLYIYAHSYVELVSSVYAVLFDENYTSQRITSTEDLYECTVAYIKENYAKPITIQSLSTSIGISQTYISRLFRKHGKTTFNTFLTRCRIDNAIRFIKKHPDTLLRDIAEAVGYEDASYFSRVFRKMTGHTPSEYTDAILQKDPPANETLSSNRVQAE